ncbi:MAG: GTPase domain-containing protein [Phycisphaerae bacterium]
MNDSARDALDFLAQNGEHLRERLRFDWSEMTQQAVHRLNADARAGRLLTFAAVIGGASSGKSTVFNNLLGGHSASRVTAHGHTTLGPILAAHEDNRDEVELLLDKPLLMPRARHALVDPDDATCGEPNTLTVLFHTVNTLRDVLLFDTPDFTSDAAHKEGDVTLSLLPWFDLLCVVIDHERWFDRQTTSRLKASSVRLGQRRVVLFNRSRDGTLTEEDGELLRKQADRLAAEAKVVLEFRRGRGLRLFPPGTLGPVHTFLTSAKQDRTAALFAWVAEAANRILNQNEERRARLDKLEQMLSTVRERIIPTRSACMVALMTPAERRELDALSRVLRMHDTRQWLGERAQRIRNALRHVPVVGAIITESSRDEPREATRDVARDMVAKAFYESQCSKQVRHLRRAVRLSAFWTEVGRWTGLEPAERTFSWTPGAKAQVVAIAADFDDALRRWTAKIEAQCQGISPHIHGAVGGGALALAILLAAAPGPLTALTLTSVAGAIGGALTQLAAAAGAGAVLAKPIERLAAAMRERLLGSPEFNTVKSAADAFRTLLDAGAQQYATAALNEASSLVMDEDTPILHALACVRDEPQKKNSNRGPGNS